jgi:hypothetical protein
MSRDWHLPKYDHDYFLNGALSVSAGYSLTIADSCVVDGNNNFIYVYGALTANAVTFSNVECISFQSTGGGSLTNCTLADMDNVDEAYAVFLEGGSAPVLTNNDILGFVTDKIALSGGVSRNWSLPNYDRDYILIGDLSLTAGYTMSISDLTTIDGGNYRITISGTLSANAVTFDNIEYIRFQSTGGGSVTNCYLSDTDDIDDTYAVYISTGSNPVLTGTTFSGFDQDVVHQ